MTAPDAPAVKVMSITPPRQRSLASSRKKSALVRYIVERGWIHLVLLTGICIFLFPFAYMLGTSLKTDEELTQTRWYPTIPTFRPTSPYVRNAPEVVRPPEATHETWERVLPQFRSLTRAAIDAGRPPGGAEMVDPEQYRSAATEFVVGRIVSRLNLDLWAADEAQLVAAYKAALLPDI